MFSPRSIHFQATAAADTVAPSTLATRGTGRLTIPRRDSIIDRCNEAPCVCCHAFLLERATTTRDKTASAVASCARRIGVATRRRRGERGHVRISARSAKQRCLIFLAATTTRAHHHAHAPTRCDPRTADWTPVEKQRQREALKTGAHVPLSYF